MSHCATAIAVSGNISGASSIATQRMVMYISSCHVSSTELDYFHHNGEILTEKILHAHRFTHPIFLDTTKHVYHITWSSFVYLLEGVIRKEKDEYFDEETEEEIDDNKQQETA